MNILGNLLGGGQQQEYQDFANRYDQGPPHEGYSDQEVLDRYNQVAPNLPPQQYLQAAQGAFERMPPDQRQQLGQFLQQQGSQFGLPFQGGGNYQDPNYLAQMTTHMHQQQPGLLGQILGGALGGGGSSGGGLGGLLGGGGSSGGVGGMLSNPAAKAALAGIAAMAVKQFMSQRH